MAKQVITLKYKEDSILTDAYNVRLASQNGEYGIKVKSTGESVVDYGTSVENPITGVYEYHFDPPQDTVYQISWGIVPSIGDDEQYSVREIGPFKSSFNLQTDTSTRGTFIQGTIASLLFTLTEFDGTVIDPDVITYTITSEDGSTIEVTGVPEKISTGVYVVEWTIPSAQDVGEYLLNWIYTKDGQNDAEVQRFVVAEDVDDTTHYSGATVTMRQSLVLMLGCAQNVPVYFQQSRPTNDRKFFYWTMKNWNQTRGTSVYRNKEIVTDGFAIDYSRGRVMFDEQLTIYDMVNADYNFRWFTDEQLDRFLSNGIHTLNMFPPQTNVQMANIGNSANARYIGIVLYAAAVDAIRSIMFCINWREPAELFGGSDRAKDVFGQLESLKKNYEETLWKLLEQKKFFPYAGLTKGIVVPEYTLPGGRSRWFRYLYSGSAGAG
jgi:hypothetical protein